MSITPGQCRAARGLLNWSQRELVERSGVSQAAIANFERGASIPYPRTLKDVRETLENAGLEFLADEPSGGIGVRFKVGFSEADLRLAKGNDTTDKPDSGLHSRAWDDEFEDAATSEAELSEDDRQLLEYIRTAPHLSDRGREVLMRDALKR
jgi:transcriptional regulator with XRE-family HTH domain